MRFDRQNLGDRPAMFGHNNAVWLKVVQNRQTPGFKFRRGNGLFFEHDFILDSDQSSDQFFLLQLRFSNLLEFQFHVARVRYGIAVIGWNFSEAEGFVQGDSAVHRSTNCIQPHDGITKPLGFLDDVLRQVHT